MSAHKKLVREAFRAAVFSRDNGLCVICRKDRAVDAHHITDRGLMPNGGYVIQNGISVCAPCHLLAESGQVPANSLYNLINSSYEIAWSASETNEKTRIRYG